MSWCCLPFDNKLTKVRERSEERGEKIENREVKREKERNQRREGRKERREERDLIDVEGADVFDGPKLATIVLRGERFPQSVGYVS